MLVAAIVCVCSRCLPCARRRAVAVLHQGAEHRAGVRRLGAGRRRLEVFPVRLHEPQLGGRDRRAGRCRTTASTPGGPDQGQPTHFLPRRNRFVFRVKVPNELHRERRADLDAHDARQDREGLRDAAPRLRRRRRREGVGDRRARRRHQQPGSSRQQAAGRSTSRKSRRATSKPAQPVTLVTEVKDDGIPKRAARRRWRRCSRGARRRLRRRSARSPAQRCAIRRCRRRRGSPSARTSACTSRGSSIAAGRRQGDVRSAADQGVGGHPRRRELAVGAASGPRRRCRLTASSRCR